MILLIDLCHKKDSLSRYEFVYPIADTLRCAGAQPEILHFTQLREACPEKYAQQHDRSYEGIILCGTALKDNVYADRIGLFSWIKSWEGPILGICAGMQIISSVFGGKIIPQPVIGLKDIDLAVETPLLGSPRRIEGYLLHNFGVTSPDEFQIIAESEEGIEAFKHRQKPIYGIAFHPEVRNKWILERFVEKCY